MLASGSSDRTVRLWEASTGRQIHPLKGHHVAVHSVAFKPDGKTLLSGSENGTIRVWNVAAGTWTDWFFGGPDAYLGVCLSPDGAVLATCGKGASVRLLAAATGKEIRQLAGTAETVDVIAFSPDGRTLAAGTWMEPVHLWDTSTAQPLGDLAVRGLGVRAFAFSPDGRVLAAGFIDRTVQLWEVVSGSSITTWSAGEFSNRTALPIAFLPGGRVLAAGDMGGVVRLWDLASREPLGRLPGGRGDVLAIACSPDGKTLACGYTDSTILLWDIRGMVRRPIASALSETDLHATWHALGEKDADRAYQAVWTLADRPHQAVPALRKWLRPVLAADSAKVAGLIAELDSDEFAARESAMKDLERLGDLVVPALRKALANGPSPEARRRIEEALEASAAPPTGEQLQALRAVQVLEYIGDAEARKLLRELAGGTPEARLTREASSAAERLVRRRANP
jgi:WD40 repeat protein